MSHKNVWDALSAFDAANRGREISNAEAHAAFRRVFLDTGEAGQIVLYSIARACNFMGKQSPAPEGVINQEVGARNLAIHIFQMTFAPPEPPPEKSETEEPEEQPDDET